MPHHEVARFDYFKWEERFKSEEKPYELLMDDLGGIPRNNFETELGPEERITDLRGREVDFSLDDNGFAIRKHTLEIPDVATKTIELLYLPSLEEFLKRELGKNVEVYFFDWRVRSSNDQKTTAAPGTKVDLDDRDVVLKPIQTAHVDQSPAAAHKRVRRHMHDRAEELLRERLRIVNIWRPYSATVDDYPLAVCDGSTVQDENLIQVDHVRRDYVGESLYPVQSSEYRWYYLSNQAVDEVFMLKMYDSAPSTKAWCCPHASFKQRYAARAAKGRESIEARALIFSPA